mgnify:CR=1 FL=1
MSAPGESTHESEHDLVLVVDFGAQYAQLIARRVREARVYSEIVPHDMPVAEMAARKPKAIILSGGPSSVYAEGAPQVAAGFFDTGVPTFGICYGFQAMAASLGGTVARTGTAEFGRTALAVVGSESGGPGQQLHRVTGATRFSDGTLVIANAGSRELYRYDSGGRFLGAFGKIGDGPGEFRALTWLGRTSRSAKSPRTA